MDKSESEQFVAERVRAAIEDAASSAVMELNRSGHAFVRDDDGLLAWTDAGSGQRLEVLAALGVAIGAIGSGQHPPDPELERYLERAASGQDRMAELLAGVEGEIANGGLMQLFDNRGRGFVTEAIGALHAVGATASACVLEEAESVMGRHAGVLESYRSLERELGDIDERFQRLDESLPSLHARFDQAH